MNLEQAVVFAILMENTGGIQDKSPDYILEKVESCERATGELLESLLDSNNLSKLYSWRKSWFIDKEEK